jgi:hypothetical protein
MICVNFPIELNSTSSMKNFYDWRKIFVALLMLYATGCADDGKETVNPQDQIEKTWGLGSNGAIIHDGSDVTADYAGLSITFNSNGTYRTHNGKKLFFPSGTWTWQGTGTSTVLMDGDHAVTVKEISESDLQLEFMMAEEDVNANGRAAAVVGSYTVTLTAN